MRNILSFALFGILFAAYIAPVRSGELPLVLSEDERTFLDSISPIRFTVDPEFAPFEIVRDDGSIDGIAYDFLAFVAEALDVPFSFVPSSSWHESIKAIQQGHVDLLPSVGRDVGREAFMHFSQPYIQFARVAVTRRDFIFEGLDVVPEDRIAVQRESSHHGYIRTETHHSPSLYDTFQEALLAVSMGEKDVAVGNLATVTYTIQNLTLANLKIGGRISPGPEFLHIGVQKELEALVPLIDRALDAMPQPHRNRILEKWVPLPVDARSDLLLTRSEREWLLTNPRIRVGWDPNWPPVEFLSEEGVPRGFSVDLLRRIESDLGIRFIYEPPRPWNETLALLEERKIDVVSCIGPLAGRAAFVIMSDTYLQAPVVLYTQPYFPYIRNLREMERYTIAMPTGYTETLWMQRDHPNLQLKEVGSVKEGLYAVHEGKADAFAGSVMQGNYYLSRYDTLSLVISGETGYVTDMRIGVRSDWPIFVEILNKALAAIPEEEKRALYRRWVLVEHLQRADIQLVLRVVLISLIYS